MTISSETRKAGPFEGNSVTNTFPFAFKVFAAEDVLVVRADEDGVETELTLVTDYTVTLNSNQDSNPGGSVVTLTPVATGQKLVVTSKVLALQQLDLTNQGGFYPVVINRALDRITVVVQQVMEQVSRSWKIPISSDSTADALMAELYNAVEVATEAAALVDPGQAASRSNKDGSGLFTTVQYRRADGTLARQSVLSGGTSPEYTTRTETVYATDGVTVLRTIVFALTYSPSGEFLSETVS
jgi:hypothetical protein